VFRGFLQADVVIAQQELGRGHSYSRAILGK
jgi:hypothetical protein